MACLIQWRPAPSALLLQPVEPVTVALAVDDVHLAVVVHVVAEDGEARIVHVPVRMPLPLVLVGVDLAEPAGGSENVGLAVAVDVGHADAVPVLLAAAHMMDLGLGAGEVDPQNAGVVVVSQNDVGLAVAVDVGHPAALGIVAVGNEVALPLGAQLPGVLVPPEAVGHPSGGHHVGRAVVVHVHRPLAAVGDELVHGSRGPVLVALPLSTVGAGILIPIGAAEDVGQSIAVHVQRGNALGVVGAETMDKEGDLGNAARTGAGSGFAFALGLGWRKGAARQGRQQQQACRRADSVQSHGWISFRQPFSSAERFERKFRGKVAGKAPLRAGPPAAAHRQAPGAECVLGGPSGSSLVNVSRCNTSRCGSDREAAAA